jgi:hypothetical protein
MFEKVVTLIRELKAIQEGIPTSFPEHLYHPLGAESIDIVENCELARKQAGQDAVVTSLISLSPLQAEEIFIREYSIYTDIENADDIEFFWKLNGKRILRYHGRPTTNSLTGKITYKLNFGLSPDLANDSLKMCQILIKPNDTLTVEAVNRSEAVTAPVGIRLVGHVLNDNRQSSRLSR